MAHRPAKLLSVNVNIGSQITSNTWNCVLSVTPQIHSDSTINGGFYNGTSVVVGDYIATENRGTALQIKTIISQNANTVTCVVEDVENINSIIDENSNGSIIPGDGILFEVINGAPVIYPLPNTLSGSFNGTFPAQLISRFELFNPSGSVQNALTSDMFDVANGVPKLDASGKLPGSKLSGTIDKTIVGLSNVDNTSDLNKPISTFTQNALNLKIDKSSIGINGGVAPLDVNGLVPSNRLPGNVIIAYTDYTSLPDIGEPGKLYVVSSQDKIYVWSGTKYVDITSIQGGETPDVGYTYVAVDQNAFITNKQVVTLLADNLILTIPKSPAYGEEIIILNSYGYSFTLTTGLELPKATIDDSIHDYEVNGNATTYLIYVNDWKVSNSNQSLNINVATEAKSTDYYWPADTIHEIVEEKVYGGKQAFIETWRNVVGGNTLAQQITIFNDYNNSDNYKQIWHPKEGLSLEKIVNFTNLQSIIDLPAVSYVGSLVFSLSNIPEMEIDWRTYETFEQLISVNTNFYKIISSQRIINLLTSNSNFLIEFTESAENHRIRIPIAPLNGNINSSINGQVVEVNGITITVANTSSYDAYKMFDGDPLTFWESGSGNITNQAITFRLPSTKEIFPHTIEFTTSDPLKCPKRVKITCLIESTVYDVAQFILDNTNTNHSFKLTTAGINARTWKFEFLDNWGGDTIKVHKIEMIGWDPTTF